MWDFERPEADLVAGMLARKAGSDLQLVFEGLDLAEFQLVQRLDRDFTYDIVLSEEYQNTPQDRVRAPLALRKSIVEEGYDRFDDFCCF